MCVDVFVDVCAYVCCCWGGVEDGRSSQLLSGFLNVLAAWQTHYLSTSMCQHTRPDGSAASVLRACPACACMFVPAGSTWQTATAHPQLCCRTAWSMC